MCGIFGCALKDGSVAPIIRAGLKRLEYRGYDSVGIATIHDGVVQIRKDRGKIDEVADRLRFDEIPGSVGVGHTRWATHGAPEMVNAHPHSDCSGRIAVVHNGVIENFVELKEELVNLGHSFVSRTDTEVIGHLIEEELKGGIGLGEAVLKAARRLRGSYAIAVVSSLDPGRIFCARNESPLVFGVSDRGVFCASDIPAMLPYTNKVAWLRNGEAVVLSADGFEVMRIEDGSTVDRGLTEVTWSLEMAEKQGYPYFMLKEIYEQPRSLRNALRLQRRYLDLLAAFLDRGRELFLVAAGTSHHACLAASYMFSKLARLTAYPVISSEFVDRYGSSVGIDSVVLAVSQSGETYDTLKAVDHARMRATTILGVTNTVGSTLTRVARAYIVQQSGPEIGVAATKTFTSQLLILAQLAIRLARVRGKVSQDEVDEFEADLVKVPSLVEEALEGLASPIEGLVSKLAGERLFLFLGRGISAATALEGRLKLLEITYVPSLAYPAGESKHGPISVVEEGVPCIFICPRGEARSEIIGSIMEMKARGARIISVCEEGDKGIIDISDDYIEMPIGIPEALSPILYVVPLQLLAYHLATSKGLDPDKPRNLAKSVTVP
ncbi:MAG: glutamine--fructose-6-phosphate transaminase (isomerizing) [Candidatus Bathyarchaeota archaeon]|nr:glutamine--fructose-6-phosphate transaminase (isomerizing) [Candidatus Bathyarchaeota archaeon]